MKIYLVFCLWIFNNLSDCLLLYLLIVGKMLSLRYMSNEWCTCTVCQKDIPGIFNCNLKTNYQISIIFGMNIIDTTCHQMTIQFPTWPNVCFCTTWGKHNQRNITFLSNDCLINITQKNTFSSHFWHCGWHFIQLSIFQLPTVKLLKVLAHYANTSKETLSSFTWQQYQ